MAKEKITEGFTQYAITIDQLGEFSRISRKLREIIEVNKKRNTRMYKDARSVRYGELK